MMFPPFLGYTVELLASIGSWPKCATSPANPQTGATDGSPLRNPVRPFGAQPDPPHERLWPLTTISALAYGPAVVSQPRIVATLSIQSNLVDRRLLLGPTVVSCTRCRASRRRFASHQIARSSNRNN